jgi:hypothetical protein
MEKVITFKLIGPTGSWIIGEDPIQLLQAIFGSNADGDEVSEEIKNELFNELDENEQYEYKIIVEKCHTKSDLEKMGESDGDIH